MMDARARSRCYLEQAAPNCRRYAERRRDGGATFGARGLRCCPIEFSRADDVDCRRRTHGGPDQLDWSPAVKQWPMGGPLNWSLENPLGIELAYPGSKAASRRFASMIMTTQFDTGRIASSHQDGARQTPVIRQAPVRHRQRPLASFLQTAMSASDRDRYRRLASYRA